MNETSAAPAAFVTYEYEAVRAPRSKVALYADVYRSFGWESDNRGAPVRSAENVTLTFKRDRRIRSRPVIAELQARCEAALAAIGRLERSRTTPARVVAIIVGLVGVAFLAGSVFSMQAALIPLFLLLGIVGLATCAMPYFLFRSLRRSRTAHVTPLIAAEYDTVYETTEQAGRLLAQSS